MDAYTQSSQDLAQISIAQVTLVNRCLAKFGFAKPTHLNLQALAAAEIAREVEDNGNAGNARRYGITSLAAASRYGYHLPSSLTPLPEILTPKTHVKVTPAYVAALTGLMSNGHPVNSGIPAGGCQGEAARELGLPAASLSVASKTAPPPAPLDAKIDSDSFRGSMADPHVAEAMRAWSRCMQARGYYDSSPLLAGGDINADSPSPSQKELVEAEADVTCKQQTKLVSIWSGYEIRYENSQIERHAQELSAIKDAYRAEVERAAKVLTS